MPLATGQLCHSSLTLNAWNRSWNRYAVVVCLVGSQNVLGHKHQLGLTTNNMLGQISC